jgi:hypothetical protein
MWRSAPRKVATSSAVSHSVFTEASLVEPTPPNSVHDLPGVGEGPMPNTLARTGTGSAAAGDDRGVRAVA